MGYRHIENLYKNQDILMFKECYALEKIHGTSASIVWDSSGGLPRATLDLEPGGESVHRFQVALGRSLEVEADNVALSLIRLFIQLGHEKVAVHGELYGGSCQSMSETYGPDLRFIVFDIKIGDTWLAVPNMDAVAEFLGLDVVSWIKTECTVESLNALRDNPSVQCFRNTGGYLPREGIVVRPLLEMYRTNDERVMAKHKSDAFKERATQPKVVSPEQLKVLADAKEIAEEWVTEMRLTHVLDKLHLRADADIMETPKVIRAMIEDVLREAAGEIVVSREAKKAIGGLAAKLFHARLKGALA